MRVDIKVINVPGSGADWDLAAAVHEDELPELNEDQRSIAKAYGIRERDYRRSELAREIAEARYRRYAQRFGEFLAEAAGSHGVDSAEVVYDLWEDKFYCYLKGVNSSISLRFDAAIITDPLERGDQASLLNAERRVEFGVDEAFRAPAVARGGPADGEVE